MIVSSGRVARLWSYYDLPYRGVVSAGSFDETAQELRERLATAVRRQLLSDVPVGAYLSGGLDSSAVVAMMVQARPDARPTCFTVGLGEHSSADGIPDDLPYARRVARHLGVPLVEVPVPSAAISRLPQLVAMLDEPQADPAPIAALMIAEQARERGIPVLLSGAGGDDLFSGYRRHRALNFDRIWQRWPSGLRTAAVRILLTAATGSQDGRLGALRRRIGKLLAHAGDTGDRRLASYFLWSTDAMRAGLYSREFAARVEGQDTLEPLLGSLARIPGERDPLQRMLYLEAKHFLADHNLNYTDRAGMAVGVEVRVPLLDLELVEFATRVPAQFKQRGSVGKAVFKRAMEPLLPRDVIYRPKSGFGVPLRRWLTHDLRRTVDETLAPDVIRARGIFDADAVRRFVDDDRAGRVDGTYTVFALICFELWCRRFVDSGTTSASRGEPVTVRRVNCD